MAITNKMKLYFTNNKHETSKIVFKKLIIDYLGFVFKLQIKKSAQSHQGNK